MLTHLTISNFTLVQALDLSFGSAMTVVTGETGAGKSIMLDALGLTLGDRADSNLIATAANKAEINSTFSIAESGRAADWLRERDLTDDECSVILRRVITRDGRSRGFINGVPTTISDMKIFGNLLIDIHSQHEHQSLLKKETQRRLLDEFGNLTREATELRQLFSQCQTCDKRLQDLINDIDEQSSRLQLLSYQAEELAELSIQTSESEQLELEQKQLANAETTLQKVQEAVSLCTSDDESSPLSSLSRALNLISDLDDERILPILDLLSSSRIQIEEATNDLEHYAQGCEVNPGKLELVESRLGKIYDIARKHRIQPAEIPELEQKIGQELAAIAHGEDEVDLLTTELASLKENYRERATDLSGKRRKVSATLEIQVSKKLAELGMAGAKFQIDLKPISGDLNANGLEDVEFLISANPGQKPGPLREIASGGELSRISLAIQVVTANTSSVPTLVFDEVDVGVGGAVAEVVGMLLRELARQAQIICVTHLPQVAAQGHQHLVVTKDNQQAGTKIDVEVLSEIEKVKEIARMLGGVEMTDQSLAHAQEMFASAQK
ncbi:MAG: DNA repair protein RecN [Gammaproteobacteria bacterium]|jgi:DNA repair protein RecN (Recombination protein N)|nr:DNA repair protein RecN [Gammaproteobacteria bacterium]